MKDPLPSISESLLTRVKVRDTTAWDRLVELYGPLVYKWCRREGLNHDEAEDVGQEVFRAVFKGIDRFRREKAADTYRGWLWSITRNKVSDLWRGKFGQAQAAGGTAMKNAIEQVPEWVEEYSLSTHVVDDKTEIVHRALQLVKVEFREKTWQAFWLITMEQKSAQDVAQQLDMKLGAIYTAKSRVLRRLREELADLEENLFA